MDYKRYYKKYCKKRILQKCWSLVICFTYSLTPSWKLGVRSKVLTLSSCLGVSGDQLLPWFYLGAVGQEWIHQHIKKYHFLKFQRLEVLCQQMGTKTKCVFPKIILTWQHPCWRWAKNVLGDEGPGQIARVIREKGKGFSLNHCSRILPETGLNRTKTGGDCGWGWRERSAQRSPATVFPG